MEVQIRDFQYWVGISIVGLFDWAFSYCFFLCAILCKTFSKKLYGTKQNPGIALHCINAIPSRGRVAIVCARFS